MLIYFGDIPLGSDHLTGPTADQETFENEFAEHATARGKPPIQTIGEKRDTRSFAFFFDEGFCDVSAEWAKLMLAYRLKSAATLVIPGVGYGGARYVVDKLSKTTEATTRSGRLVRIDARIELSEDPRVAGVFGVLAGVFSGSVADAAGAAVNYAVRTLK
ncbi:phage tail protein [Aurantimonas sp. C2-6-R+9]|uniref:phage tail protein n=1 Tax=unclassified Aurantimonas TaxID=2638230 RepID=UPI002E19B71A|nr:MULTISPECIES: phage tail protein [unclassified Aurantimonas]MEC5291969.1 phage tail protein [Aurantimonas sp. C2-3-R2]MEC5382081.1 phage tail protein [Aurantimonas sp. C2-6-R+9]MEC5413054.1 phage tail protein [Aurantimonas sp. C2-4-R8]